MNSKAYTSLIAASLIVASVSSVLTLLAWQRDSRDSSELEIVVGDDINAVGSAFWDVGDIDPTIDQHLVKTIRIRNTGHHVVRINGVKTNCGCLVVDSPPESIGSGSTGSFELKYRVGSTPGPIQRLAIIDMGTDGASYTIGIKMAGRVMASRILKADVDVIKFGRINCGPDFTQIKQAVRIARMDGSPVGIRNVEVVPSNAGIEYAYEESQGKALITLKLGAGVRMGPHTGYVNVRTTGDQYSLLQLPFEFERYSLLDNFVKCIALSFESSGIETEVPLRENANADFPHKIVALEFVGDDRIHVGLGGDQMNPTVRVLCADVAGTLTGTLQLTIQGNSEAIAIPLIAVAK